MRNLIILSLLFIVLDIIGSWVPMYFMNQDRKSISLTIESIYEAINFRLFFAFWYWIAAYLSWIGISICIFLALNKSLIRSLIISLIVPIAVLTISDSFPILIWYSTISIFFGLLFHKYVNSNHKLAKNSTL